MSEELHRDLAHALSAWSFNVMLECSGRADDALEVAIGGAVLDLRDLDRILTWMIEATPAEAFEEPNHV